MDRFGIELGLIGVGDDTSRLALKKHPDRFVAAGNIDDPNHVTGTVRAMRRQHEEFGIRAVSVFPAGTFPQVAIDDPKMYPIYANLRGPRHPRSSARAGVPGPR